LSGCNIRVLLTALLVAPNRPVSTERLSDAIWSDAPPKTAAKNLQVLIHQLRQALGEERITTHAHGYSLAVTNGELDTAVFQELVAKARNVVDIGQRRDLLTAALDLWRGPVLADLADVPAFAETAVIAGDLPTAAEHAADALMIAEQLDNPWLLAEGLFGVGSVALAEGDPGRAVVRLEEALRSAEKVGYRFMIARTCLSLAQAYADLLETEVATAYAQRARDLSHDAGYGLLEKWAADLITVPVR
jgi:hypothetical protein